MRTSTFVRFTRHAILAVAVLALAGIVSVGNATPPQPGPLDVSGEINGAPFRIIVPAVWNGTLVEFARGYTDRADHPGEIDNRNPTIAPNNAVRDSLLARGYALAGSARKNNGWSVEDGLDDVVALVSYFRENVANPSSAILWGASGGTVIALETAERNGGAFDGFLTTASVGAGASRTWDQTLVLRLAYDVTFGMPGSWERLVISATTSTSKRMWRPSSPRRPPTRRTSVASSSSGWWPASPVKGSHRLPGSTPASW
jgi:hypothetical protein